MPYDSLRNNRSHENKGRKKKGNLRLANKNGEAYSPSHLLVVLSVGYQFLARTEGHVIAIATAA